METKPFDSVEMQHEGAEKIRIETASMTREQEIEYWRQKTRELRKRQAASRPDKDRPGH